MLLPTRFSQPLSPIFRSDFDRFLPAFRIAWRSSRGYTLDPWQEDLLRRIGELRPNGHLRYRQVLISCPRQQGKSELAAALGLWGLLRKRGALVIGIASSAEQSRIIYDRTQSIIRNTPALHNRFVALTDTRGIRAKDGGRYEIRASKSAALQGLPIDLGIIDEVHLVKQALWVDLVNGTGSRDDCLVIGTTTAGDDTSELLLHLYSLADTNEGGDAFGYFVWEASEARVPKDDEELARLLLQCSPAYETGRVPIENVVADVRSMPDADVIRYRLNRFVASVGEFVQLSAWNLCRVDPQPPPDKGVVLTLDRSPEWEYATVTASWFDAEKDLVYTEVVASENRPTQQSLVELAASLYSPRVRSYVMDSYSLKAVGQELKQRGMPVICSTLSEMSNACSRFYSRVIQRKLQHPGDQLLSVQLPGTRRKNVQGTEAFRVTRSGATTIDAVCSTILGCYFAETLPEIEPQLFV